MIKLTVEITVKNHNEVIALNKGATIGKLAGMLGNTKNMVEGEIRNQAKAGIKRSLEQELASNGVKAEVNVF